jgi:uncharacterized protein (DUF1330 family)
MSAYIIAMVNVSNPENYAKYSALASVANEQYGGKFIVRGGNPEVLEGSIPFTRVVVNVFETREQAKKFYNSVEYQASRQHRMGAADFNMMVVDGA